MVTLLVSRITQTFNNRRLLKFIDFCNGYYQGAFTTSSVVDRRTFHLVNVRQLHKKAFVVY